MQTWIEARTIDEAVAAVAAGATVLGGGASLLSPALAPTSGPVVVDVGPVLHRSITDEAIGAGTTLAELARDDTVRRRWPALAAAAALTATPQVRAVATVGGTVGAALPTSDILPALVAHGAEVEVALGDGSRHRRPLLDHLREPDRHGPVLVVAVRPTRAGPGTHRRIARRSGPAPALASVSAVRGADGLVLVAGAVGIDGAPVPLVGPRWAPGGPIRDDARAGADLRRRLLDALVREVVAELDGAR